MTKKCASPEVFLSHILRRCSHTGELGRNVTVRTPVPMHGSSLVQVRTEFRWPAPCDSQVAVPCKRPVRKRRQWGEGWLRRPAPNLLPRRVLRWRSRGAPSASASSSLRCSLSLETDRRGAQRQAQHAGMHVVGQSVSPSTGGSPRTCGQGSLAAAINQPGRRAEQLRTDGNVYGPAPWGRLSVRARGPRPAPRRRRCMPLAVLSRRPAALTAGAPVHTAQIRRRIARSLAAAK